MSGIILPVPEATLRYHLGKTAPQVLEDIDSSNLIQYMGWAGTNAAQTDPYWIITHYTYDGNNNVAKFSTLTDVIWTLRATYTYP